MILAGDIGGTNTRVALFDAAAPRAPRARATYRSAEHRGLAEIVRAFVEEQRPQVEAACFGVAGPVIDGRCEATNLPWVVDARDLAAVAGTERLWLINDLEANAHGVGVLEADDFHTLGAGDGDARGNVAVISAGTGLGEAGVFWDGAAHHPFATEGGHANFGPRGDLETELLHWLRREFDHVSWERVVSGPGLVNVYRFLRDSGRGEEPAWLAEALRDGDRGATISRAALEGRSDLCVRALDLFVSLYGSEAGNLALKLMATGGVLLGGGIAPKILPKLKDGTFMRAFLDKGRMKPLLEAMPVRVILNDQTALFGAARCAARRGGLP